MQRLHVAAVHPQGNAGTGHIAHHAAHDTGGGHLTGQVGAQRLDLLPRVGAEGALRHGEVAGDVKLAVVAAGHTQAAHVAAAHHKAGGLYIFHGHDPLHHLIGQVHRLCAGDVLRHGDGDRQVVHVDLRHEREAAAHRAPRRRYQQHQRQQQHTGLVIQRPRDGPAVGGIDLIQQTRLRHELAPQHTGGHGRYQCQRHQQAGQQRIGDGQRQIGEQLAGQTLHEHDGREHAHRGKGGRRHRAQHLLGAGHRRLHDGSALGPQTVDILDDHHRVIHQHTHRYRQAAEGDHVDGHAGEVHQHHRENDADGDGEQRDNGGTPVTQEQKQHHHGEQRAPQQGREDRLHDQVDIVALIHQRHEGEPLVLALQLPEPVGKVVGHRRRGVVGLLVKGQQDAVFVVKLGVQLVAVVRHHHGGHVAQRNGVDALQPQIEQHHILQLGAVFKLLPHRHHVAHAAVVIDVARGHGEVLGRQQAADGGDGQKAAQIGLGFHLVVGLPQLLEAAFDLALCLTELQLRAGHLGYTVHHLHQKIGDIALQLAALQLLHQLFYTAFQCIQTVVQLLQRPIRVGDEAAHQVVDVQTLQPIVQLLQVFIDLVHRIAHRAGYAVRRGAFGVGQRLFTILHLPLGSVQLALRLFQLGLHRVRQLGGQRLHLLLIQNHMGLPGQRAGYRDAGHAADALQLAGQLVRHQIAEGVDVAALPGHGGHHHRDHGRVDLQHIGGPHRVGPLPLQHGDLLLDIHTDGIHVHAVLKLQHHHGRAVLAGGGDLLDLIQRGHGLLHGPRDLLLHRLGTGAGIGGDNNHIRKIHIGQQIRRHPQIRHDTQHHHRQYHHKYRQRPLYAEFCHTPAPPWHSPDFIHMGIRPILSNEVVYHAAARCASGTPKN